MKESETDGLSFPQTVHGLTINHKKKNGKKVLKREEGKPCLTIVQVRTLEERFGVFCQTPSSVRSFIFDHTTTMEPYMKLSLYAAATASPKYEQ